MCKSRINSSTLHHTIIKFIIDKGYAPELSELSKLLDATEYDIHNALEKLQEDHGVVLHSHSSKIWVIHPLSLAPTNFWVRCDDREWWGNCAWCS